LDYGVCVVRTPGAVSAVAPRGGGRRFPMLGNTGAPEAEKAGCLSCKFWNKRRAFKVWGRAVCRSDLICTHSFPDLSQSLFSLYMQDPFLKRSVAPPRFHCSFRRSHPRIARALSLPDTMPMRGRRRGKVNLLKISVPNTCSEGMRPAIGKRQKLACLSRHSIAVPVRVSTWRIFCRQPRPGVADGQLGNFKMKSS